jgi:protease secretion system membrane fusion protein
LVQLLLQQLPLMDLEPAVANANHTEVRQRYLGLRAMQGRLQAEQSGQVQVAFHPVLLAAQSDPQVKNLMAAQLDVMRARRNAIQTEIAALEESFRGQTQMIQAFKEMLSNRKSQRQLLEQELNQTRPLVDDGYAPKNRLLELERALADVQSSVADLNGQVSRAQTTMAEIRQKQLGLQQNYRREVETQLADVSREVQADAQKLVAVSADLQRMHIRSPADGQVVGLAVQTTGAVVQPGQKLMVIVPENEPLLLEARIDPSLIDKVKTGLITDIRFNAFSHSPNLVVEGRVESVSSDLLTDPATNVSYYLARVVVTPTGMSTLGKRRMQPGMPAEVIIKTGERTLLTYLMSPLVRRVAAAMKEE